MRDRILRENMVFRGALNKLPQKELDREVEEAMGRLAAGLTFVDPDPLTSSAADMSATRGAACWKAKAKVLDSLWRKYQEKDGDPLFKFRIYDLKKDCNCINRKTGAGMPDGDNAKEYGREHPQPAPQQAPEAEDDTNLV